MDQSAIIYLIGFISGLSLIPGCMLAVYLGQRTGEWMNERDANLKPIANADPNFEETEWINRQPPWTLGGSVGEKQK